MNTDLTRRNFLKLVMATGIPVLVPVAVGERTVVIEEVWIDEDAFEGAVQVTSHSKTGVTATIDTKQAFSAVRCMDDEGRIWLIETEGDPNECGGLQIKALTCGSMRIEV